MKKFIAFSLFILFLAFYQVDAYSLSKINENTQKYETLYRKKVDFSRIKKTTLEKLQKKIEALIEKIENDEEKSDTYKETMLGKLFALKNIIDEELSKEVLTITIIADKRCTNCYESDIESQLKEVLGNQVKFVKKDFSDMGVSEYLKENNINFLPAFVFSTNQLDDENMKTYLQTLPDNNYSLQVGAQFDPFALRSERGFLVLDREVLSEIKDKSYIYGEEDALITWIEYSDLECPFCARLHNAGTKEVLFETYAGKINKIFQHFPLAFHENAMMGAEILECVGEQGGENDFYALIESAYADQVSDKESLFTKAEELGVDIKELESCLSEEKYKEKIEAQMQKGTGIFSITGTPGNVLINTKTGEYIIISGAYPTDAFQEKINLLIGEE